MKLQNLFGLLLIVLGLFMTSCGDDDELQTIAELASDTDNLSTLVAALERAELTSVLDGTSEFTVFAPTNEAFDAFLAANNFDSLEDIPVDVLSSVLLNHVVSGTNLSTGLANGYVPTQSTTSISSKNVDMYINIDNGVTINGQSTVTTADVEASNGVVHIVNSVIVPATVTTFATADPTFATLAAALTREAEFTFATTLAGAGTFTVFAPTNDAFGGLLEELGANGLEDIATETLANVLAYHVVSGANVLASQLTDGQEISPLFDGADFTIDLDNGAQIIDNAGRTTDIIVTDVQAVNGVVHVINRVILP